MLNGTPELIAVDESSDGQIGFCRKFWCVDALGE
jgi:hypothetical protein